MQRSRKNLWYSLLLLFIGGLLIRLSFSMGSAATVVMISGLLALLGAMVIFLLNFRE